MFDSLSGILGHLAAGLYRKYTGVQFAITVIGTGTTVPIIVKKGFLFFFSSQSWQSLQSESFSRLMGPFRRAECHVWQTRVLCLNKQIFAMMSRAFSCSSGEIAGWQNFYAVLKLWAWGQSPGD